MTQVSTTLSNPWWNQFQKIKCTYKGITLNKYIWKMHCQLAETCRNEVENNNIINRSILNVLWTEVTDYLQKDNRNQNVKHCFGSLFLIVTCILLNYMNNYNQGNYFLISWEGYSPSWCILYISAPRLWKY